MATCDKSHRHLVRDRGEKRGCLYHSTFKAHTRTHIHTHMRAHTHLLTLMQQKEGLRDIYLGHDIIYGYYREN